MAVTPPTLGLVLAGGQSRRMGCDKALLTVAGQPLLHRALQRLAPQVTHLALSSNQPLPAPLDLPQLADTLPGHAGPLAGILTGLEYAREKTDAEWMVSVAVDTPFFPTDLVAQLHAVVHSNIQPPKLVVASSGARLHPTFALWHVDLTAPLHDYLYRDGERRMLAFCQRQQAAVAEFECAATAAAGDSFFNLNTPADLALAEARIEER